ncbi:MAG: tryptophan--tRNA ligase [Clostridia bacterium]|nr:tryptophan--tRNA ligase [Clostridia bacterium]
MKQVVLTGIKPTGILHIGNYFGAIKPGIELANNPDYDCYYFIADYHALNIIKDKQTLKDNTFEMAASWLACGIDPKRVVFYQQSKVPEVTELNWLLSNVTSKGLMNRAHAYKAMVEKAEANGDDPDAYVNMGLFNYPILMAADILLFNTKLVPIGQDQKQHVEMARDIAKAFNKRYGYTFVVPQDLISEGVGLIPGTDGQNKMSKSHNNIIPIFATEQELKKLISAIKTDSSLPTEPKSTDCALFNLYKLFATEEQRAAMAKRYAEGISWADAKAALFELINNYLSPMREKYNYYKAHPEVVKQILAEGSQRARAVAKETIKRARLAMGLD